MGTLGISDGRPLMEITTRAAKLHIHNKRPVFKVRRVKPVMHVERKAPTFKVNWLNVRAQSGRPSPLQMSEQFNEEAYRKTMEAIAKISQKGDSLMHIHNRNNVIAQIAREHVVDTVTETNISLMPQRSPEVEWDLGYFKIEWSEHALEIEWEVNSAPDIYVEPHVVEVRVRNHPAVKIKVNRNAVRNTVGGNVDRKI